MTGTLTRIPARVLDYLIASPVYETWQQEHTDQPLFEAIPGGRRQRDGSRHLVLSPKALADLHAWAIQMAEASRPTAGSSAEARANYNAALAVLRLPGGPQDPRKSPKP